MQHLTRSGNTVPTVALSLIHIYIMDVSIDSDDVREQLRAMLALELFLHLSAEDQERVIAFLKSLS